MVWLLVLLVPMCLEGGAACLAPFNNKPDYTVLPIVHIARPFRGRNPAGQRGVRPNVKGVVVAWLVVVVVVPPEAAHHSTKSAIFFRGGSADANPAGQRGVRPHVEGVVVVWLVLVRVQMCLEGGAACLATFNHKLKYTVLPIVHRARLFPRRRGTPTASIRGVA